MSYYILNWYNVNSILKYRLRFVYYVGRKGHIDRDLVNDIKNVGIEVYSFKKSTCNPQNRPFYSKF